LKRQERTSAILSPLGTGMSATAFGREAMAETGFPRFGDHRDYTRELAERGFVTLTPAYPWLGTYEPDLEGLGYQSGTMKAIWDNIRGLDLLESLPFVRPAHFGAIGHSLGAHNVLYTAAFENRLQAIVSSCGFDSFLDYMNGDIRGWTQDRYMPRLKDYPLEEIPFDFHEVLAVLAPRACFVNAPRGDSNFQWESAARVVKAAAEVYRLHQAEPPRIEHPDAGHSFPDGPRFRSYALLEQALNVPLP
jgi:pimeloyl-ACP methyl ester carboxylesterase